MPLADVIPILQDMGLKALVEDGYAVRPVGRDTEYWIHEFVVDDPRGADLVFRDVARPFEEAFIAAWTGQTESDGFSQAEEHTSELQSLMRISYAVFCLKKKKNKNKDHRSHIKIQQMQQQSIR